MAVFGGIVLTNDGKRLEAKVQLGKILKFKRIALGDGTITTENIFSIKSLINEVLSLNITSMELIEERNMAKLTAYLNNKNLGSGFTWRELGIIAEDPDTKEEVLYGYGNARNNAEYICAANEGDLIEKHISTDIVVSNVADITVVIDESLIYMTEAQVQELIKTEKETVTIEKGTTITNEYELTLPLKYMVRKQFT